MAEMRLRQGIEQEAIGLAPAYRLQIEILLDIRAELLCLLEVRGLLSEVHNKLEDVDTAVRNLRYPAPLPPIRPAPKGKTEKRSEKTHDGQTQEAAKE